LVETSWKIGANDTSALPRFDVASGGNQRMLPVILDLIGGEGYRLVPGHRLTAPDRRETSRLRQRGNRGQKKGRRDSDRRNNGGE